MVERVHDGPTHGAAGQRPIAAVACTPGYLSFHDAEGYSPVPVMKFMFIDENQLDTNTVNWGQG